MQKMAVETENGGPYFLVLYWIAGEYTWSKILYLGG
jgi:hypothetical protein